MRKAIVKKEFFGAADGELYPKKFYPGDIITGELAAAEVETGRAEWEGAHAEKKPPRNSVLEKAPRNKLSLSSQQGQASEKKTRKRSRGRPKSSQ